MDKIMYLDLEVENHPYYGQLASPRHPDNYVVMVGWAVDDKAYSGEVQYTHYESKEQAKDWLTIPEDVWLLVCHNASFEIDWMWQQQREELTKFINRGGRIFCTQLGHYRLSKQRDLYPSLDEIAPEYGGSHKIDAVKLLWDQGKLTSEIDTELLTEYLAGPEGDIENTRKLFWGQYKELTERGMWGAVLAQCDGLLFNALCMSNGMHIGREVAFNNLNKLNRRITELGMKFGENLATFGEDVQDGFKLSSLYHKSAWIYGGKFRVDGRVPALDKDGNQKYLKMDAYQTLDGDYVPCDTVETVPEDHNFVVYRSGKNKGRSKVFRVDSDLPQYKNGHIECKAPGLVNLDDYPTEFLDTFYNEHTTKLTQFDGSPIYSSSEEALEALLMRPETSDEAREVLGALNEWATLNKIVGSFYLREDLNRDGTVRKV